ncbi:MAG: MFS transporter, partial [Solirubrobacteraceae bacterium]|nr:MFS transporter [Solirubrobacteraceae bacterium]
MTSATDHATRHRAGFWAVAYAFVVVMAFSAIPTPLYVLYQARDGFSSLTVTLIFAVYALGVVASLFLVGHLSDRDGRRRWMIPAILLTILSAVVFLTWSSLTGLLVGRFLNGLGVGAMTATATAWIAELHATARPGESPRRAQTVATASNLGGIGLGPLVGGVLAQWVSGPLVTPYAVMLVALVVALVAVALTPETRQAVRPAPAYRPQTIAVPHSGRGVFVASAMGAFVAFALMGLFNSLAPAFVSGTLGHTSRALAGFAAFVVFAAAAGAQVASGSRSPDDVTRSGMVGMVAGPALLIASVWLPSLPLFLIGGAVSGAGAGLMFKGSLGAVAAIAPPAQRAEALAGVFLAGYIGLTVPVIGLGLLTQELAANASLTVFAVLLMVGVAATAAQRAGAAR